MWTDKGKTYIYPAAFAAGYFSEYTNKMHKVSSLLVFKRYKCFVSHRIRDDCFSVKVFGEHIDGGYRAVFVSRVIINTLVGIEATGIYGYFVFAVRNFAAAALLFNRTENVKELPNAFFLALA